MSFGWPIQPEAPALTSAILNRSSVVRLPFPRTAAMARDRCAETVNFPSGRINFKLSFHRSIKDTLSEMGFRPNFISFFSGARGLDLGLEEAGWECLAANEFDRVTCDTIRLNAPELQLYDTDIRELTAGQLQADLGLCGRDLFAIVGGPPCQAFSTAGRRLGLNDARGNVFLHFLDLIGSLKPKYAVFENVRGLLSAPLEHRPHDQRGARLPEAKAI